MQEIKPNRACYIKLGSEGGWEKECLENQTIRFGYNEISHEDCVARRWNHVEKQLQKIRNDKGAIRRDLNQIKEFYEAGTDVLWVTFHGNSLRWCFSNPEVTKLGDGSRFRKVIDQWRSTDVKDNKLSTDRLRGSLLSMQGYRGTICKVKEFEYLVNKINGKTPPRIEEAQAAYKTLVDNIESLIRGLHWKDFELLVDLIFRDAGWKRIGKLGGPQKTIDLELLSPVTNEKISVQVKSKAGRQDYLDYKDRFAEMAGYARFFFAVHTPEDSLENYSMESGAETEEIRYLGPREVAKLCVDYGLAEWVMHKAE